MADYTEQERIARRRLAQDLAPYVVALQQTGQKRAAIALQQAISDLRGITLAKQGYPQATGRNRKPAKP